MSDAAIALEGVTKTFGPTRAVDGVSFSVPAGSIYGLIGPNGAGKTTTFSMICGFLSPDGGRLSVLGRRPGDRRGLKGRLGVLPQDALLPPNDTLGALFTFYGRLQGLGGGAEGAVRQALASVGLEDRFASRCSTLSHGMAKRAGVAQAFLGDPELVLLDEPTAGLDPKNAHQLRELIRQMKGRRTVVVSSHNLNELEQLCDGAAILDKGKVVSAGSMGELTRSAGEVRILLKDATAPVDELKALAHVAAVSFDPAKGTLLLGYDPATIEAEEVIGEALRILLSRGARISAVTKGRGLEERVLELT